MTPRTAPRFAIMAAIVPHFIFAAPLDDLSNPAEWSAAHSEDVEADIQISGAAGARALRLNYDFGGVSGFAVATRRLPIEFPENFEISFRIRGAGAANDLQLKFVDESGDNVWWYQRRKFAPTADWQTVRINKRHIAFAWGPTADRALKRTAKIEWVIYAVNGGRGHVEIDALSLTPLPIAAGGPFTYSAKASAERTDGPAAAAVDGDSKTGWISGEGGSPSLTIDLGTRREFGGLEIDWLSAMHASKYSLQGSDDLQTWRTLKEVTVGNGGRDVHYLPESEARAIRIVARPDNRQSIGIAEVRVKSIADGESENAFLRSIAKASPRGWFPRSVLGEQSYWTIVGTHDGASEALLGEDGALESRHGGFSVEPFVLVDERLYAWSDVEITHSLADNYLPIPTVSWRHDRFGLAVTAVTEGDAKDSRAVATYTITNRTRRSQNFRFALALRPLQVNPASQFLGEPGGFSRITSIRRTDDRIAINGGESVIQLIDAPDEFAAAGLDAGTPAEWLTDRAPERIFEDASGMVSGLASYRFALDAGQSRTISIAVPLDGSLSRFASNGAELIRQSSDRWRSRLNRVRFDVPKNAQALIDTVRTSHAHILINRDGPILQPGSRAYARSWIRDGAMEANTLLRLGDSEPAKDFLRFYAPRLFANGKVPCCVDGRGSDPVPENDSAGEFIFLAADVYRYTGDKNLLEEVWPQIQKAMGYLERLRLQERTADILQSPHRAFYGLVPASISHEGYSAKPMHSYWDDFWTMKGYDAAVQIATAIGDRDKAAQYARSRDEFRADLRRSLQQAMSDRSIHYLPGSAELGDFDATSTSIAVSPSGDTRLLPGALEVTFERYWSEFIARKRTSLWEDYTPYEWRNVSTFAQLGWRERIPMLLDFFMQDRRPAAWNQWAEVVGRDLRKERFIGDMPHSWVGSDFIRSVLDLFAYERSEDRSLVLMAGIPSDWFDNGFGIDGLRTPYGEIGYRVTSRQGALRVRIRGARLPPGGLAIDWPFDLTKRQLIVRAGGGRIVGGRIAIDRLPFEFDVKR